MTKLGTKLARPLEQSIASCAQAAASNGKKTQISHFPRAMIAVLLLGKVAEVSEYSDSHSANERQLRLAIFDCYCASDSFC